MTTTKTISDARIKKTVTHLEKRICSANGWKGGMPAMVSRIGKIVIAKEGKFTNKTHAVATRSEYNRLAKRLVRVVEMAKAANAKVPYMGPVLNSAINDGRKA